MTIGAISNSSSSTYGTVSRLQQDQARILATLASGKRINSAADDPAGLVISQMMQSQLSGDNQASNNVETATSLLQTADGGLDQTQSVLNQMRTLALQASNSATSSPEQTAVLNAQFTQLSQSLNSIAKNTTFGSKPLLDGSFTNQSVQVGNAADQTVGINISSNVTGSAQGFDSNGLGLSSTDLSSPSAASDALSRIDAATSAVGQQRGAIGAIQSDTLSSISNSLAEQQVNLSNANSTISDTDFAKASTSLAKNQILDKSSMAMMVQGNLFAGQMLSLLKL